MDRININRPIQNHIEIQYYKTKFGEFILGSFKNKLCLFDFRYRKMRAKVDYRIKNILNAEYLIQNNKILKEVKNQINEYFSARRKDFEIPILTVGSTFQKKVWKSLKMLNMEKLPLIWT